MSALTKHTLVTITVTVVISVAATLATLAFWYRGASIQCTVDLPCPTWEFLQPPQLSPSTDSTASPTPFVPKATSTPYVLDDNGQVKFPENTIDTSDWLTYRNERFGFEMQYPKNFTVSERSEDRGQIISFRDNSNNYYSFTVVAYKQAFDESLSTSGDLPSLPRSEGHNAMVNNLQSVYFGWSEAFGMFIGSYSLGDTNHTYSINYADGDRTIYTNTYQKMILSIKSIK